MRSADQIGMLALPANARRLTQRFFHDRRGIDKNLKLAARRFGHQPARQRF